MEGGKKRRFFWTATVIAALALLMLLLIPAEKETEASGAVRQRVSLNNPYSRSFLLFPGVFSRQEVVAAPVPLIDAAEDGVRTLQSMLAYRDSLQLAVPDYVEAEAEAVADRILSHHGSIVFPFISDAHCGYYTDPENSAVKLLGQLLRQIGTEVPYSFIVNGGDLTTGAWDTTRELTFSHIEAYWELVKLPDESIPLLWAMGNHDDAPYQETRNRLTQQDTFALMGQRNVQSGLSCPDGCNYGYLDLEEQKLRVIVLDTDDKREWGTVQVGAGQSGPDYLNAHNIGAEQLRWLADSALDFREKENADQWSIIVISHVPLNVSGWYSDVTGGPGGAHSTANAATILRAYKLGTSGSLTHNGEPISYDYSGGDGRAEIICMVHGHEHRFTGRYISGILSIGCPNAMNGREKRSLDGNIYTKIPGTAEETSFCILTVDKENRIIYADCVGAGYDREFTY